MAKLRILTAAALVVTAFPLLSANHAVAATSGSPSAQTSYQTWKRDDGCAKRAFEKNPDYTREGIAARDKFIRNCELQSHVPLRDRTLLPAPAPGTSRQQ